MSKPHFEKIGALIDEAYFDDGAFRKSLRPLLELLETAARKQFSEGDHALAIALNSSVNSYFVSSYHATRVIELVSESSKAAYASGDYDYMTRIMSIGHSFALEAVQNLASSRLFLLNEFVLEALELNDGEKIVQAYNSTFPNVRDARNSLVHDEERILSYKNRKRLGQDLAICQARKMVGARLELKFPDGSDMNFCFPSAAHFELVEELVRVLGKA